MPSPVSGLPSSVTNTGTAAYRVAVKSEYQTRAELRSYTGRQSQVTWLEVLPLEHVDLLHVTGETKLLQHDLQPPAGEGVGEHNDPIHHTRVV